MRDEIAQLKGHKGKPNIKPNRPPKSASSSEKAKGQKNSSNRPPQIPRQQRIKIDREQVVKLARGQVPKDVVHRGYREVTLQNIVFKTDTVLYRLERLYSASTGKLYEAQLLEMLSEEPSSEKPNSQKGLREYIEILVADDAGQFHHQTQQVRFVLDSRSASL